MEECVRVVLTMLMGCAVSCPSCARPQRDPPLRDVVTTSGVEARIGSRSARFVFPPGVSEGIVWPARTEHAYVGLPTDAWEVSWEKFLDDRRFGVDPHAIALVVGWRDVPAQEYTLAELLLQSRPEVHTFCQSCRTPASRIEVDSAVRVHMEGRHVVFEVRGRAAIRRILPTVPDSVTFTRRVLGRVDEQFTVAVRRADPKQ